MKKEINVVILEDNQKYGELKRLTNDNNVYVFLSNIDSPDKFCIRKLVNENDEEYLVGLDSKEEFYKVFQLFSKLF